MVAIVAVATLDQVWCAHGGRVGGLHVYDASSHAYLASAPMPEGGWTYANALTCAAVVEIGDAGGGATAPDLPPLPVAGFLSEAAAVGADLGGGATGGAAAAIVADEAIVSAVEQMGFPKAHAAAAARATLNVSIEQAMEWCISNPAPAGGEDHGPQAPPAVVSMPKLSPRGKGSTREDIIARRLAQKAVAAAAQAQEAEPHLSVWTGDASGTLTQWTPAAAFGDSAEPPTVLRSFQA